MSRRAVGSRAGTACGHILRLVRRDDLRFRPTPEDKRHLCARDPLDYLSRELDALKQQGLYRHLRVLEGEQSHQSTFDHRQVVNLSSNNYLGLTTHPRLREKALEAVRDLGVGSGSVRTIAGTMDIHMELERRLAAFKKTEAVVVFQSGFAANAGTVAAVLSKEDVVDLRRAQSRQHHRRLPA